MKSSRKQGTASTSSAPDGRLCFRCKQPGHLKKDYPELPYCSKCKTQGHIPAKCPTKNSNSQQDKRCKSFDRRSDEKHETRGEEWRKAQDQPQFSNMNNRCLNCAEHMTAQQGINIRHPPLAILLMAQVFITIHNSQIILKVIHHINICNKVHPQLTHQLPH